MLGQRRSALESAGQVGVKSAVTDSEWPELGVMLAQFGANTEAGKIFQKLWQKKPQSYPVGFNLALMQYRSGQSEAALRTVEQMLSRGDHTGELLTLIYRLLGY